MATATALPICCSTACACAGVMVWLMLEPPHPAHTSARIVITAIPHRVMDLFFMGMAASLTDFSCAWMLRGHLTAKRLHRGTAAGEVANNRSVALFMRQGQRALPDFTYGSCSAHSKRGIGGWGQRTAHVALLARQLPARHLTARRNRSVNSHSPENSSRRFPHNKKICASMPD